MLFRSNSDLNSIPFRLLPSELYFGNVSQVFQTLPVAILFFNTLFVCAVTCFISGTISIVVGFCIYYSGPIVSKFSIAFLFALTLLPTESFILIWLEYVGALNLYNTLLALTMPNILSPFCCLISYNQICSIKENVWKSLSLETESRGYVFFHFIIRHCIGKFKIIFVYLCMFCWESFMWPLLTNYSINKLNLTAAITRFMDLHSSNNAVLITASLLFTLPYAIVAFPVIISIGRKSFLAR